MNIINRPFSSKDTDITVEEMSVTYRQSPDTNSDSDEYQRIKLTTQWTGWDDLKDPFPYYINIEIPEGHWSIDGEEDMLKLIKDFKNRVTHADCTKKE